MPGTGRNVAYGGPMARHLRSRFLSTITVVAALVPGSAGIAAANTGGTAPLARFYEQSLDWSRCSAGQCAWLTVPRDYSDPDGPTLRLRVSRTPAGSPADRQGSLVTNPGGPGAEGVEFASYLSGIVDPAISRRYDIVGFDTRGAGESSPIVCMDGWQTTRWLRTDYTPDTPREIATLMRRAHALAQGCLDRSPQIARHVGSENTVRDMDILRQALDEDQLDFLGFSYGTYLGTRYAEVFPDRVGRFVLDGAVDPSLDVMQLSEGQSRGFQVALSRFADDCARRPGCPWRGDGTAVLVGIDRLLSSLDARPLPARPGPSLVQSEAITALLYAMYAPQLWPMLRSALREAARGEGSGLSELAAYASDSTGPERYGSNMASAFPAIACWDQPAAPGAAGLAAAAQDWARGTAVPEIARTLSWGNAPCSVWFGHSAIAPKPARTSTTAPILIIGGLYDPATPYAWATALHRQLPTSALLTYAGDGHTAYGNGSTCVDSTVRDFLLDGTLPASSRTCR